MLTLHLFYSAIYLHGLFCAAIFIEQLTGRFCPEFLFPLSFVIQCFLMSLQICTSGRGLIPCSLHGIIIYLVSTLTGFAKSHGKIHS